MFRNLSFRYYLPIANMCFTLLMSALLTKPSWRSARLRAFSFLVRMCLLKACLRLIFPVPVTRNLFFALEFVFIFGMTSSFFKEGKDRINLLITKKKAALVRLLFKKV